MALDLRPVEWVDDHVRLLDQTRLPGEEVWLTLRSWRDVAEAIRSLRVRGAPAIGVAAAMGVALAALESRASDRENFLADLDGALKGLAATRPTGFNLFWALDRMRQVVQTHGHLPLGELKGRLVDEARAIHEADVLANRTMGRHGASLIPPASRILTHCNAGALATGGYGTALGVVRAAHEVGKVALVWVDETRPVLQGSRLTAWELVREEIPHCIIADGAAASLMARKEVDLVVVGADRIAANGDTANKVGTYALALLARAHALPFYVAAPTSTIDLTLPSGDAIPIEEREPGEVSQLHGILLAPKESPVFNPAFDVTPAELITALITERGVVRPPSREGIHRLFTS